MYLSPRIRLRLLGLLPLFFFVAQIIHYWGINQLGHVFWMCNVGNFLMAIGLFIEKPMLVRVAAIWTIPGLIVWFVYVVLAWGIFLTSTMAHVGGLAVAVFVVRAYGMDKLSWLCAFAWYLAIQILSRFVTAVDLNVNLAHAVQPGWEQTFTSYWMFWLTLTIVTVVVLWLSGLFWRSFWPAVESSTRPATSTP